MSEILELGGISVSFGGLRALRDVSFAIEKGAIHGLIGPNGAGKTTLINVLSGLIRPTAGSITFDGSPLPARVSRLRPAGLARTFQTPVVFPELSAIENVMFGATAATRTGLIGSVFGSRGWRREEVQTRAAAIGLLADVGFDGDPEQSAASLSFGNERKVEVARALMCDPAMLLLDEPTAGFSRREVDTFAALLRKIRDRAGGDLSILLVEHNVPFIFGLCDAVTALDDGAMVGHGPAARVRQDPAVIGSYLGTERSVTPAVEQRRRARDQARQLVGVTDAGTAIAHISAARPEPGIAAGPALRVDGLSVAYGSATAIRDVTLDVSSGEVVAVLGRNGAGKSTLFNAIMRTVRQTAGTVTWNGLRIDNVATEAIVARGVGLVPQNRAVLVRQTVHDNLRLSVHGAHLSRPDVERRIERVYDIFPRLVERRSQLGGRLSGGERQMLAIGKALMREPALLLLDEPSIGLAVGVVLELQEVIARINDEGTAVLIAEQNVSWVVPLADRAYVLDSGNLVASGLMDEIMASGGLTTQFLGA